MTKEIILAAIFVIITIGAAIFASEPVITFKPFSLSVRAWYKGAFILLIMALYVIFCVELRIEYYKGVRDGIHKTIDYAIEQQKDKQNGTEQHQ